LTLVLSFACRGIAVPPADEGLRVTLDANLGSSRSTRTIASLSSRMMTHSVMAVTVEGFGAKANGPRRAAVGLNQVA